MRITYLINSLGMGGAERQALDLAERMAVRGHTVAVLTLLPRLPQEWPTGLPIHHLDMSRTAQSFALGLSRARGFLRSFQPDLLHGHSFHANLLARLLKLQAPRTVVVSTVHNVYEGGTRRMVAYRLTDALACRTTAVSQAAADRFVRIKAVPAAKCAVLLNAIDISGLMPNAERRARTRAAMGVTAEFVWLTAGRLVPAKDHPNLLRALDQVRAERPSVRLWIAGETMGNHVDVIPGMVKQLNLGDNVCRLGLRRDMPALFDAADGFVLASAWEGMPLVLAEAMAMEKPVVATDVGGVCELVGSNGVLVPPRDSPALARAMLDVMRQPVEIRRAQGCAARRRIAEKFNIEARVDEWEKLYSDLLGSRA